MDFQNPETALTKKAPRLLEELNANPTLGGVCYSIIVQSTLRAYRLGRKVEGIRFEPPVLNGTKVFIKATYSTIEGLYTNPIARQADLEQYMRRKNGALAEAITRNGEYVKLFNSLVEMLKGYASTRCKPYSQVFVDKAGMSLDDVFYFEIKFGVIE
jgi:hypothetical protein